MCNPTLGVTEQLERASRRTCKKPRDRCSSRRCHGKTCGGRNLHKQCGRGGACVTKDEELRFCKGIRPNNFFELIEEIGPDMEMDMEESNIDLDYGNIGNGILS